MSDVLPGPFAVAGLLREGGLQHQLVRLVVEVVVQVVPQQTVDQNGLSFEVIPERGGPEPVVEDGPDLVQLADHLVSPGVIEVTLGSYLVQSSPVLTLQLLENLLGTFLRFLTFVAVDEIDEDKKGDVEVDLREERSPTCFTSGRRQTGVKLSSGGNKLQQELLGFPVSLSGEESLEDRPEHHGVEFPPGDGQSAQHSLDEPRLLGVHGPPDQLAVLPDVLNGQEVGIFLLLLLRFLLHLHVLNLLRLLDCRHLWVNL